MTELFLNNQFVEIDEKASVKVKVENPYFTGTDKSTLDVNVPIKGNPNNIRVLGHLCRMDVSKKVIEMSARLVSDNRIILNGIATVTKISDEAITLQLLAGQAEINFRSKYQNMYLDELDMGAIPFQEEHEDTHKTTWPILDMISLDEAERYKKLWGKYGETNWVYFPIYNSEDNVTYNKFVVRAIKDDETTLWMPHRYNVSYSFYNNLNLIQPGIKCAAQPYLCFIIRRIFEILGYEIEENGIENSTLRNIFLANTRATLIISEMMPHWTVSEFLEHIEDFFAVIVIVDDTTQRVRIVKRNDYFSDEKIYLDDVLDEYSVTVDDAETTDISNGNIGYDFDSVDAYEKINQDIVEQATIKGFDSFQELQAFYETLEEEEKPAYLFQVSGEQYMHYVLAGGTTTLKKVNQFRDLQRNTESSDTHVSLKLVPAQIFLSSTNWEKVERRDNPEVIGSPYWYEYKPGDTISSVMLYTDISAISKNSEFNLQEAIEGDTETSDKWDSIAVAMNDGILQTVTKGNVTHTFPWPFVLTDDPLTGENDRGFSFELNKVNGRNTMFNEVYGNVHTVDTTAEFIFNFMSKQMYSTMKRFIIRNKQYVCKQIDYKVTAERLEDEKTGYFYEYTE